MYKIDLISINFNKFISKKNFIIFYKILKNKYSIMFITFINFKTILFLFLNILYAIKTVNFFNIIIIFLKKLIFIYGFNEKISQIITYIIIFYILINERYYLNVFILIID